MTPALIDLMDELNVHRIVDLDGGWGEQLEQHLAQLKQPYPDRFCVFAWVDWAEADQPGFGEKWAGQLRDAVDRGAQGLKVFKSLGLRYRDGEGNLIRVDHTVGVKLQRLNYSIGDRSNDQAKWDP